MKSFLWFISIFLHTQQVFGLYAQCGSNEDCVKFSSCSKYKAYAGSPAASWPLAVQKEVQNRLCNVEQQGNTRIYNICCAREATVVKPKRTRTLNVTNCGPNINDRIVAFGKNAMVFEYPWMALLRNIKGIFSCGGSLIADSYVLTAAHCNRIKITVVRLGEHDISAEKDCNVYDDERDCAEPPQDIEVAQFIAHPMHSARQRKNDIALIKLVTAASFSSSVIPICLPVAEVLNNDTPAKMIITGWGLTEAGSTSNVLQQALLPLVQREQCQTTLRRLSDALSLDESQFCAGGDNKVDSCSGDSGGPLQQASQANGLVRMVQYGVVSFGVHSCGVQSTPGVYTNVSHYIEWISQNLLEE